MAFSFPTRHAAKLFFPTVHIHDGKVHKEETFDHVLYCQSQQGGRALHAWEESPGLANSFAKPAESKGILLGDAHLYRRFMGGRLPNQDVLLESV